MIIARPSQGFVNVNVYLTDDVGGPIMPDGIPTLHVYRVNAADGSLALDVNMAVNGMAPMDQLFGEIGFYGYGLDISAATHHQYELVVRYLVLGSNRVVKKTLLIDTERETAYNNRSAQESSRLANISPPRS